MTTTWTLFRRFILRDLKKNWVRSLITLLGIALGVSVYLSITLANHTALAKFKDTVDEVSGKANLEICPRFSRGVDESVLNDLQWLWDIDGKFTPVIDEIVALPGKNKPVVELLGIDMLGDPAFKTYSETEGTGTGTGTGTGNSDNGSATGKNSDFDSSSDTSVFAPRAVLIGSRLAQSMKLNKGDWFNLLVNDKLERVKIVGILSGEGLGGAFSGNLVVADIGLAQMILNTPGMISRIAIIAPEASLAQVKEKLEQELPKTLSVVRPSQRGEQVEKMTKSFEYNLLALTFIAVMVGMFLIYNTMTISVLRKRHEVGTLRAIGVSKWQIVACFFLEAVVLAIAGTALGVLFGLVLADGALKAVSSTINHFYFQHPIENVSFDWKTVLLSAMAGCGLTLLAAIPPVLESIVVSPAEATRRASYESKLRVLAAPLCIVAVIVMGLAYVAALQPPVQGFPLFGYVAAFLSITGAALVVPLFIKVLLPRIANLLNAILPGEGKFAARSLYGTLGRSSVAVASLMIGIAMMVSLAIMIGSFRQTVLVWVNQTLQADLWLQSAARAQGSGSARLNESMIELIKATPGVLAVDAFVEIPFEYCGLPTNIAGADLSVRAKYGKLSFVNGEKTSEVLADLGEDSCLVSECFAIRKKVKAGDVLHLTTPSGARDIKVQAIYYDYASDLGYIILPRATYRSMFNDATISSLAIYLRSGEDPHQVREAILKSATSLLKIRTTSELRGEAMRVFDRTFAITYALHTIAIAIAMLSIMNALFALTLESRREFGILRYLGATARQLEKIVLIEAGLLGLFGNITGLALGWVLSQLLIHVINKQSFGWTVQLVVPYDFLIQSSIVVLATAVLSGILPARMAAKTLAPQVVRDE